MQLSQIKFDTRFVRTSIKAVSTSWFIRHIPINALVLKLQLLFAVDNVSYNEKKKAILFCDKKYKNSVCKGYIPCMLY